MVKWLFFALVIFSCVAFSCYAEPTRDIYPDTWVATDALGRTVPVHEEVGSPRPGKWVGIFYWTWHIHYLDGPHNLSQIVAGIPEGTPITWPSLNGPYHWGEPELGYYVMTDPFVIRKHASMLADAGVDVIFFDTTNAPFTWREEYEALCAEFESMRSQGNSTPYIAFICPFWNPAPVFDQLWNDLYQPGKWRDLWFMWKGKPLILADPADINDPEILDFFTFRKPMPDYWMGPSGPNQWSWLEVYPQHVFFDESGSPEQMSVGVAQNALPNTPGPAPMSHVQGAMGRSWHNGAKDPRPDAVNWGLNFDEQWRRALEVDPSFIFVTGWNEWIALRFDAWGGYSAATDCYYPGGLFVDEYTQEYSRDCEPMRGGHTDNYYYQLASWIRKYKGARPIPTSNGPRAITLDGMFDDWADVEPEYRDTVGDIIHRDHHGYGSLIYQNFSGRNDIISAKAAFDGNNLYFYAQTANPLSSWTDPKWMLLLLDLDQDGTTGWLGYDAVINDEVLSSSQTTVKIWNDGAWVPVGTADLRLGSHELELAVSRVLLGKGSGLPGFDFHWADNIPAYGDVSVLGVDGDSAPNRRWNYRFIAVDREPPEQVSRVMLVWDGSGHPVLRWEPPYDDVGVSRYRIFRNGTQSGETDLTEWTFSEGVDWRDEFGVRAMDAAGNIGPMSPLATLMNYAFPAVGWDMDWEIAGGGEVAYIEPGRYAARLSGAPLVLQNTTLHLPAASAARVRVRLDVPLGTSVWMAWQRSDKPDWSNEQEVQLSLNSVHPGSTGFYEAELAALPGWTGTITAVRFSVSGVPDNTMVVTRSIQFTPTGWGGDADGDGLSDGLESYVGTDQFQRDTDGDGLSDREELRWGSDPLDLLDTASVPAGLVAVAGTAVLLLLLGFFGVRGSRRRGVRR
ncbi:MAG TPA: thrombospondin type 3 repeat-containing protein [Candidatus Hydrogenedentes bacterium]|nr:hypothetical protein [Candidatus Hydrogenedentota bacterium]HOJ68409.1 thrombospondin type 3 repeat-containing protein [Candidatus Hydrogenedentota bacterium]HOK88481.1 thrombospondin type 3 repeat-containing protein [Candidatus Hydrogenedentota bacterium]